MRPDGIHEIPVLDDLYREAVSWTKRGSLGNWLLTRHFIHFTTLHVSSVHVTSLHFTTLHYTTSRHVTTPHFTSRKVTSLHFTPRRFTSLYFTSLHFTSRHFTSLHFTSCHVTSRHVTSLYSTCSSLLYTEGSEGVLSLLRINLMVKNISLLLIIRAVLKQKLLIISKRKSSSWVASGFSCFENIPHILWHTNVHYRANSSSPAALSWARAVQPRLPIAALSELLYLFSHLGYS